MSQTQTKTCRVSGGSVCSCTTQSNFCPEHDKAMIKFTEEIQYEQNPRSFRNPPQPYQIPPNTCGWGCLQPDPFSRCLAQKSIGCWNLCKVHYDMYKNDPFCVIKGTQVIMNACLTDDK